MRILLKALRKTFTSTTLVGFVQYLILGFLISIFPCQAIFGEVLLWSGYLFLFLLIFINRLELVSKTVDEGKGDIPFISEEKLDKEKTALLRVFKRTFYGRFKFIVSLIFAIYGMLYFRAFEAIFIVLAAIYLILFMICFLIDESGFLLDQRFSSAEKKGGPIGSEGGGDGGGGGDCGGGGGGCGGGGGDCGGGD